MTAWRRLESERRAFHTPIALRPLDDFTEGSPLRRIAFALDRQSGPRWVETGIAPVHTPSMVVAWPGLGRAADPATAPVVRYRARMIDPDGSHLYRPAYAFLDDGIEVDVHPWNDSHPPAAAPARPALVRLFPGVGYPFPRSTPVLRGRALDSGGAPLANARISSGLDEVLTNESGAFALPIRLSSSVPSLLIDGAHHGTNTAGDATIPYPAGLETSLDLHLV